MYQRNLNNYKTTQILTADPGKIILMLLDGSMSFIEQARECAERKEFGEKAHFILRTKNILLELLAALDYENGADIARNLREIYIFLLAELDRADISNDLNSLKKCGEVLTNLRDGWSEMLEQKESVSMAQPKAHVAALSFSGMA
ncbi:MAG: flagellar export chaperone FliS [Deferribacteres bacterium]|nr:flagellar export chaperone FliS [candidate division KSB1 bacterium]MCB9504196.1 flagellar export chaperone FliS [Deferribacteres bacterium]